VPALRLPLTARQALKSRKANKSSENLSVLFVDDDRILRKLFSRAVEKVAPSWKMLDVASGKAPFELVSTENYELIFMDQHDKYRKAC